MIKINAYYKNEEGLVVVVNDIVKKGRWSYVSYGGDIVGEMTEAAFLKTFTLEPTKKAPKAPKSIYQETPTELIVNIPGLEPIVLPKDEVTEAEIEDAEIKGAIESVEIEAPAKDSYSGIAAFRAKATKTKEGNKTRIDNGDSTAVALRAAKSIAELWELPLVRLYLDVEELKSRYSHLNPGQQRMVVGIKLRSVIKKAKLMEKK